MYKKFFYGYISNEEDIMNILQKICLIFTLIGALNWGLVGIFEFNLVTAIFGDGSVGARIVYAIVGICAVVNIMLLFMDLGDHYEHHSHHHDHHKNLRVD